MSPMRPLLILAIALIGALGAAGCGSQTKGGGTPAKQRGAPAKDAGPAGDIPDNQAYVAYSPPGARYSVKVPEGWSRSSDGAAITFTDKLNSIRVESAPAGVAPTVRDTRSTDLPRLRRTVAGYRPGIVSPVTRHAGIAIRTTYLAAAPADPVTGKRGTDAVERYVFHHGGTDLVLTLAGPEGADNVDPWRIVTDSVRWTR